METNKELHVRCTNCWEGFDWQQSPTGDRSGECPRCGGKGQVIKGGFLVFAAEQRRNSEGHA
jgi:DNA-directed RNA polymerase subunit RPC12/RpoP